MSRIPQSVVDEVYERAGAVCEACGGYLFGYKTALHHRKLLSRGGEDTAINLMLVHGDFAINCHNITEYSIHQNSDRSHRLGHMVHTWDNPADIAVQVERDLFKLRH